MILGTLGSKLGDPHLDGLIVANTVFGGTFASRLNNELRTKRGFTYGAGSHVGRAERREAWAMQSSPEAEHTVACAAAHMELMEQWIERGITKRELSSAKRYLRGTFGFDVETPSKRLDIRLERYSAGLDPEAFVGYPERMRAVTLKQANDAVRARLDPNALTVVVVAEAEKVRAGLEALPGVRSVEVLPFTTPLGE
jgi:zinc protease